MDPATAFALAARAIAEMVTEIVKGQPPEIKRQLWEWYIRDQERWRKFFKMDE